MSELRQRALEELERGDTASGIATLKEVLEEDPEDDFAWLSLGSAYVMIGHAGDALRCLSRAVELDGTVVDARLMFARALASIGKIDDAVFQLLQASKNAPGDSRVAKELGLLFFQKKRYPKARDWLVTASQLDPSDARTRYSLGLVHEALHESAEAIASFREALRIAPDLVDAQKTLVDALAAVGEPEQALRELDGLLVRDPTNERLLKNRSVLADVLREMKHRRLLGQTIEELKNSALVGDAQLRTRFDGTEPLAAPVRFIGPMLELYALRNEDAFIHTLALLITDPEKASRTKDAVFEVTVVNSEGKSERADFATGAHLFFLRQALGCALTKASELYGQALSGQTIEWGDAAVGFETLFADAAPKALRHALVVRVR